MDNQTRNRLIVTLAVIVGIEWLTSAYDGTPFSKWDMFALIAFIGAYEVIDVLHHILRALRTVRPAAAP